MNKEDSISASLVFVDGIPSGLECMVELIKVVRPAYYNNIEEAERNFEALLVQLEHDDQLLGIIRKAVLSQLLHCNFMQAITESGLVRASGFLQEMAARLRHKIIPPLQKPNNFLYLINHIFYKNNDEVWVAGVSPDWWKKLFNLLGVQINLSIPGIRHQLHAALNILCKRTVALGLENEIAGYADENAIVNYPFILLDKAVEGYLHAFNYDAGSAEIKRTIAKMESCIEMCKEIIKTISEQRKNQGTSLSQTYILYTIQQQLDRLFLLCEVLNEHPQFYEEKFMNHFIKLIHFEKKKNSLRELLNANLSFIAYKITEHGGIRGQKYITTTQKEYGQMFRSAMLGGFIISFTAFIKNLIIKLSFAPFWQGFAFSANYFAGFQIMHETKATLATKQPAFTASAFAASLNTKEIDGHPDLYNLAITTARAIRSQTASFAGNLIIVFPMAYFLAWAYFMIAGHNLVDTETAHNMLVEQHPWHSLSILYACFTGFFLFASGLTAGYVENGINYGKVGERLLNHPRLRNSLSPKKLNKLVYYVEHNMGSLVGNIALGGFLGMAGFIGHIFGIPFDIRHITIAAGNTAISYFTQRNIESTEFILTVFLGVLLIGFFNFLVSFLLAFFVALKSRGVRLRDYPQFVAIMGKYFVHYPFDFIWAPKKPRSPVEVKIRFTS